MDIGIFEILNDQIKNSKGLQILLWQIGQKNPLSDFEVQPLAQI